MTAFAFTAGQVLPFRRRQISVQRRVRFCPSLASRVIVGHSSNTNFLWKTAKKSCLVFMHAYAYGERLQRSLRFQTLGLTTSQVIVQSKIGRDFGRCHGMQEGKSHVWFCACWCKGHEKRKRFKPNTVC